MSTLLNSIAKSALCASMLAAFALGSPLASAAAIRTDVGFTTNTLAANDDGSTDRITLPFDICFFGVHYNSLWVNNNGNVTFNGPLSTFTPFFPPANGLPIIAPFFADVDTRGAGSGLVTYGTSLVTSDDAPGLHQAFGVNWPRVGYFPGQVNKLNTFQLVLVSLGTNGDFDGEFNYGPIGWETGGASGGVNGLGGSSALVGYSNGAGTSFSYPGSLVNGAFIDGGPNELQNVMLNDDGLAGQPIAGRIEFECRNCAITTVPEPGTLALLSLGFGAIAIGRRRRS